MRPETPADALLYPGSRIYLSPNPGNTATLPKSRGNGHIALTSGRRPLCSRNLWEAGHLPCVTLLPSSLSPSYPGTPPGVASCHPHDRRCAWALFGAFFISENPTRTKPLTTAHPEQANERQEPRSEPDDRRRDDRPRAHRSWRDRHFRLSRRRGASDLRRDIPAERGPAHSGPA